jgi:hypothetical protein
MALCCGEIKPCQLLVHPKEGSGLLRGALAIPSFILVAGCAIISAPREPELVFPPLPNPIVVAVRDPYVVWETVVDVVDDYFPIDYEEPVRVLDGLLTEGRLDTFPLVGATYFEPWRQDSVGRYERLHATLQSLRRRATVRVVPTPEGFRIQVVVVKELEDVPAGGSNAPASFRNDASLTRVSAPPPVSAGDGGWIPLGRDFLLEQRLLNELVARLGQAPVRPIPAAVTPPSTERNAGPSPGGLVPVP